jgi:hypothetical protein
VTAPDAPGSYSYRSTVHPGRMRGVLVVLGRDTDDPNAQAATPAPAPPAPASGAFLGGIGISAFALRRPAA